MFVENLDEPAVPERPPPGRIGPLRPWIEWFGAGRLIAGALTVVLLVGVGWWLLRSPSPPTEAGLPRASAAGSSTTRRVWRVSGRSARVGATGDGWTTRRPRRWRRRPPRRVRVGAGRPRAGGRRRRGRRRAWGRSRCPQPRRTQWPTASGCTCRWSVKPSRWRQVLRPSRLRATGPVDLNRASAAELDELPGIGPATAAAIVEHREQHGPFASVEDLEAVRGIGPAKLDALRDLVRV